MVVKAGQLTSATSSVDEEAQQLISNDSHVNGSGIIPRGLLYYLQPLCKRQLDIQLVA
jgi:hypothetical protein